MKLIEFMRANDLDDGAMADRVGTISSHGIRKLKYGERGPSLAVAIRIQEVTDGAVAVADWLKGDQQGTEAA